MVISPDVFRKEVVQLLNSLEAQITEIKAEAERQGVRPEQLRDSNDNWVMVPLLLAKVQAISTLAQLNLLQVDRKKR